MTPEQDEQYRQLAIDMVNDFGEPLFNLLLDAIGDHARLLNTAADGIWLGMRATIKGFPPELLQYLKKYSGTRRIQKFLLQVAPSYIAIAPIEHIEKAMDELYPILDRLAMIRNQTTLQLDKGEGESERKVTS